MSMKVTKEEFLGGLDYDTTHTEECDVLAAEIRQYLLKKYAELTGKCDEDNLKVDMFKVEYLGEWKDDDGRE